METITITNQKGGVGKTTVAHALTCGLIHRGFKVLAIDLDPQMNFTVTSGVDLEENETDLYDLFKANGAISSLKAIQEAPAGFHILAGSVNFAGSDKEFTDTGREYILKEILQPLKENYDYCIIDTPPTLGILVINALTASNKIIVPMGADVYSLQGLSQLQGMINNVKKYCNPELKIDGLLLNKYNSRGIINRSLKDSLEDLANKLETRLYKTAIREAIIIKEVQFLQSDLFKEYPKANITMDFEAFINEFLQERK